MLTSPTLAGAMRRTVLRSDASSFTAALSAVRAAEANLRAVVEELKSARSASARSDALHRRQEAMRALTVALQQLQAEIESSP